MEKHQDKITLLLVDDEVEFLESTARALERRGFKVSKAQDGSTALALIEQTPFDVAVLDVKMPGIPGDELFREIKRCRPTVPVIMLTGHGSVQQAFQTSKEGVFEYLTKPCDMEKLAETAHRAANARTTGPTRPQPDGAEKQEIRLLIVDDEEELLDSLLVALKRRGMQVSTAEGGVEALQLMEERVFDVVLLDVKMPGIDGVNLLRLIKDAYPLTEVILLTGHPSVTTAVNGMKEGAFDYITKPQDMEVLVKKVRLACDRSRSRTETARKKQIDQILERQPE